MATTRRYRRITAADNPTTLPNRTVFPVGGWVPNNQPPYSNPSTAAAGSLGAGGAMLPARPQYVPPGQGANVPRPSVGLPTGSFSGWTPQNAAAQRTAQAPQPGQYLGQGVYLNTANAQRPPVKPAPTGMGYAPGSSMYGGAEYTAGILSSGQLLTNMSSYQLQQLQQQGMDVSLLSQYYQPVPGKPGQYTLNAAGLQAQTQAQTTQLAAGNSDFMNTKFMQQYAAQGTSYVNQMRWDPKTQSYMKIGDLIRRDNGAGGLGLGNKNVELNKYGKPKKRRSGGGADVGSSYVVSSVAPVPEPQTTIGSAQAFINFSTATG